MWHIHYNLQILVLKRKLGTPRGSGVGAAEAQGILFVVFCQLLSKSTQKGRRLLYPLPLFKILLFVELDQLSQTIICIITQMPLYKAFHW